MADAAPAGAKMLLAHKEMAAAAKDPVALGKRFMAWIAEHGAAWDDARKAAFPTLLSMVLDYGGDGTLDEHAAQAAELVDQLEDKEAADIAAASQEHFAGLEGEAAA